MKFALIRGSAQPVGRPGKDPDERVWNQIFPMGTFYRSDYPDGKLTFDRVWCEAIKKNWEKAGRPALPMDYLHRGEATDDLPLEQKIASGWVEDMEVRADGLWVKNKWTARARAYIEADEFRYLSPTFHWDGRDHTTGGKQGPTLYLVALLNDPEFFELPRVAAGSTHPAPEATGANTMDPKKLRLSLGLAENATDEQVEQRAKELSENEAKLKAQAAESEKLKASNADAKKVIEASADEAKKLAARVQALEDEKESTAVDSLCASLIKEDRIDAKQQDDVKAYAKVMGIEAATKFFTAQPKRGRTTELGSDTQDNNGSEPLKKFETLVALAEKDGKLSGTAATRKVLRDNPELAKSLSVTTTTQKN